MPYSINRSDGTLLTNLQDLTRDTDSTSLTLVGRGAVDYGEAIAENFVHLLENFSGPVPPANPLQGQTWFHTFEPGPPIVVVNKMKIYDGTDWVGLGTASGGVNPPENPEPGDLWFNAEDGQIYYYDGNTWKKIGGAYTGIPDGQSPTDLDPNVPLPPPPNPQEGDLWWMLPERRLWAFDSKLANISSFPPKSLRVDGSLVPNGWVLIGPQGIQDPDDPNAASYSEVFLEDVIDPETMADIMSPMYMVVLAGKITTVWSPKMVILKRDTIKDMPFGAWSDPYDPMGSARTLRAGVNTNHSELMVFNGQISDAERLNGLNASQFIRSDVDSYPLTQDVVLSLGTPEQHWLNFFSKYIYAGESTPENPEEPDIEEVNIFGKSFASKVSDYSLTAEKFLEPKDLITDPTVSHVDVQFLQVLGAPDNVYTGTAMFTEAGLGAIVEAAEEALADAAGSMPGGSFVRLDASTAPNGNHDIGTADQRFGTIYAITFDGTATKAKFADLAERYASDQTYVAGTLVSLGGVNEITQTTSEFDYNFFGVISYNPAHLMNADAGNDTTHPPVALHGRVPVRVIGKVKKGDRLILSNTPGVACAATSNDPMYLNQYLVVGRALADKLDETEGLVEAVVLAK